jgi:hypothetical protein
MKKNVFLVLLTSIMLSNCSDDDNVALDPLSQTEINDLKFLREEEKLARDVYLYSYDKYKISIFNSISQSEQTHTESVLSLLNKYGILDPASTEIGVFKNQDLQALYTSLTAQASISLVEALKVGATVEDLDINDIDDFIVNTTKSDLLRVYENLNCGSKNHIRSYTSQLAIYEVIYVPQFISVAYYNEILSSSNVKCGKI